MWTDNCEQHDYLQVQSDAIIAIKKAFDANDIMIPFPIRTLDFGIKGGVTANEVMQEVISNNGFAKQTLSLENENRFRKFIFR